MREELELRAAYAVTFLGFLSATCTYPVSHALLFSEYIGVARYGLLLSVANGCAMVAATLLGRLSDRWGRQPAVTLAVATGALAYILYAVGYSYASAVAPPPPAALALLSVARVLVASSMTCLIGTTKAVVSYSAKTRGADQSAAGKLGPLMGAMGVGFATGQMLGGALSKRSVLTPVMVAIAAAVVNLGIAITAQRTGPAASAPAGTAEATAGDDKRGKGNALLSVITRTSAVLLALRFLLGVAVSRRPSTHLLLLTRLRPTTREERAK